MNHLLLCLHSMWLFAQCMHGESINAQICLRIAKKGNFFLFLSRSLNILAMFGDGGLSDIALPIFRVLGYNCLGPKKIIWNKQMIEAFKVMSITTMSFTDTHTGWPICLKSDAFQFVLYLIFPPVFRMSRWSFVYMPINKRMEQINNERKYCSVLLVTRIKFT